MKKYELEYTVKTNNQIKTGKTGEAGKIGKPISPISSMYNLF